MPSLMGKTGLDGVASEIFLTRLSLIHRGVAQRAESAAAKRASMPGDTMYAEEKT